MNKKNTIYFYSKWDKYFALIVLISVYNEKYYKSKRIPLYDWLFE